MAESIALLWCAAMANALSLSLSRVACIAAWYCLIVALPALLPGITLCLALPSGVLLLMLAAACAVTECHCIAGAGAGTGMRELMAGAGAGAGADVCRGMRGAEKVAAFAWLFTG